MAEQEPEDVGRKGGAAEHYLGAHPTGERAAFYEPLITAVTDIVVPASRIQWGPVFAGLLIALATLVLWAGLGVALGFGTSGLLFWLVGFSCLGLFLGTLFAARTAKAPIWPAIFHGVIIWSIFMLLDVMFAGNIGGGLMAAVLATPGSAPAVAPISSGAVTGYGWWFFGGFLVMLAAAILGAIAGAVAPDYDEEPTHATAVER